MKGNTGPRGRKIAMRRFPTRLVSPCPHGEREDGSTRERRVNEFHPRATGELLSEAKIRRVPETVARSAPGEGPKGRLHSNV